MVADTRMPRHAVSLGAVLVLALAFLAKAGSAGERRVAGLDELEIFEPGVDEGVDGRAKPAVTLEDDPARGVQVRVPPTVHVHRYYYNGDKEYQGPIISGGPTVVVAAHPRTGRRVYIDVSLPSGAPVIRYTKRSITYVFPHEKVEIEFGKDDDAVKVELDDTHRFHLPKPAKTKRGTRLTNAAKKALHSVGSAVAGAAGAADALSGRALESATGLFERLPLVSQLHSAFQRHPQRARTRTLKSEAERRARKDLGDMPTVR